MNNNEWYDYEQQKAITLPPIGVECEVNNGGDSDYFKCKVAAYHAENSRPIIKTKNSPIYSLTETPDCWKFRPLDHATRAKESERKEFVEFVTDILHKHCCATKGELRDGAEKLFELGFKLPEGE